MNRLLWTGMLILAGCTPAMGEEPSTAAPIVPSRGVHVIGMEEFQARKADGPRRERRASSLDRGVTTNVVETPLSQWTLYTGDIPPFTPIRTSRSGNDIVMMPNEVEPANCFGWIEGPLINVSPGENTELGNSFGLRVTYESPLSFTGEAIELRARMNTGDFGRYALAGDAPNEFRRAGGTKTLTATFDRNRLNAATSMRLYVDFLSAWANTVTVDPNFTVRIKKIEYFTTTASVPVQGCPLISVAEMEEDGDVRVFEDGSTSGLIVRDSADAYVYDGPNVVVLDNGRVYGYSACDDYQQVVLEDDDSDFCIAIALAGDFAAWMEVSGQVRVYDFYTGDRFEVIDSGADNISAAGDGYTLLLTDDNGPSLDLYQYAPLFDSDIVLTDDDTGLLFTRQSGIVPQR